MTSLTITLPLPPKECSPNGRFHWARKARAVKACRKRAHLAALGASKGPPQRWHKANAAVSFYFKTAAAKDPDNCIASMKAYFDGIADAGIVANDKGLWPLRPTISKDASNPRVEITITPEFE